MRASVTSISTKRTSLAKLGKMRLIATGFSKPSSPSERARYTSPIPPTATRSRSWY